MGESPIDPGPVRRPPIWIGLIVYALGWSWPFAMMLSGVSADRTRIPLPRKLELMIVSLACRR